jgi:23S rRNA pseudouridine1911/1915/1917 synthase
MNNFSSQVFVIYQDEVLAVVSKPSGLVVNTSDTTTDETLQDLIPKLLNIDFSSFEEEEFVTRAGIVHRLDKDTSGVLIIAKNPEAFKNLQGQFKMRAVKKKYVSLVYGALPQNNVEIRAPLARNPKNRFKHAVVEGGKDALTKIEKIQDVEIDGNFYSLLDVYPETGRTHQIRVHLAALNHPVVGDVLYAGRNQLEVSDLFVNRLMLHALEIKFTHPVTNEQKTVVSELPTEFQDIYS